MFYELGRYLIFIRSMFFKPERFQVFLSRTIHEMNNIGVGSLPIVAIISIFVGAVTTVQTAYQLVSPLIPLSVIGEIVSDSSMLELAPTITCLVLAGKVGANIASEVGNMRITEQIDAYEVMGINSSGFLGLPKIIAGLIMIPSLIIIANSLLIGGGIIAAKLTGIMSPSEFVQGARSTFKFFTLSVSLVKSFVFAFIITSVSTYEGYFTNGGALEVGESGTRAVTRSCVLILFFDFIIAKLML
ncbi:MAG: ABC transporter permease [Bacteroidetes bacterium]|nr:ABC transporter permease [Bacteroidota bacterium]